jgi:transglutaminase-like putative cysteine protease
LRRVLTSIFFSFFFLSCSEKAPRIGYIDPPIGVIGQLLNIYGEGFGKEQAESYITIAGSSPTSASYIRWQDDLISLRVPEFGESGLIYVYVDGKRSNGVLFSNRVAIPRSVQGGESGLAPRIVSVSPEPVSIGSLLSIQGSGFGNSRERSGIFFSWTAESSPSAPAEVQKNEEIEVSESEGGYEYWSEREIRVRVPDGAVSGNLELRSPRGNSRPVFLELARGPGTKAFRDKRSYTISYTVDVSVQEASGSNSLYLWIPQPVSSASQRNVLLLNRNREPFVENYRGTSLFQLQEQSPGKTVSITQSYQVEVFAQETVINAQQIRQENNASSRYSMPSPLIPSDDEQIKKTADSIVGREKNPYMKAKRIYEWMLKEIRILNGSSRTGGALEALQTKSADAYQASLLFCALARAAGIPAIPDAGVLILHNRGSQRHYWAEFWIDGFGWVPVDSALGAGAAPSAFTLRENPASWYFGNLDNMRICFSRDQTILSPMDPRGRSAVRNRDYAMQNLWEEASGGLESYSSLWGDITITGAYVQ